MRVLVLAACLVSLVLAGCRAQGVGIDCNEPPARRANFSTPEAEQTMADILANLVLCMPDDRAAIHAANIGAGAGDALFGTLAKLYRNDEPDAAALAALGHDLDHILRPQKDRFTHTNLLNEAVRQQNYHRVVALLKAGADPNGSGSLMAYAATTKLSHPGSPAVHLLRDGRPAVPLLQAYLDNGGAVNSTEEGGFGNASLIRKSFNNLAAKVFLLENGADGWSSGKAVDPVYFGSSDFGSLISGARSADQAEKLYILVQRGFYRTPDEPLYADMAHDILLAILQERAGASGPTARHKLWTTQRLVRAMIQAGQLTPSDEMQTLLAADVVPDNEGGWLLKKGALHQPFDDSRVGAVLGTEIW